MLTVHPLVFEKISAHSFKNVNETCFGFLVGDSTSSEINNIFPVSHLDLDSCSLHTAFSFLERYLARLSKTSSTTMGTIFTNLSQYLGH